MPSDDDIIYDSKETSLFQSKGVLANVIWKRITSHSNGDFAVKICLHKTLSDTKFYYHVLLSFLLEFFLELFYLVICQLLPHVRYCFSSSMLCLFVCPVIILLLYIVPTKCTVIHLYSGKIL